MNHDKRTHATSMDGWEDEGGCVPSRPSAAIAREHESEHDLEAKLGHELDDVARLTMPPEAAAATTMSPDARRLLEMLDGHASFEVVVASTGMSRTRALAALVELQELGLVA